jgi:hypothetical protein
MVAPIRAALRCNRGPTMNFFTNTDAIHVDDPLSAFPPESEIEQAKAHDRTTKITSNRPAPEVAVLISVLSELQNSVHSLAGELTKIEEIARDTRDDARKAITVATSIENRMFALESRNITSRSQRWLHHRAEQALCWWERCLISVRGLLTAARAMLVTGRVRAAKIKEIVSTRR